MGKLTEFKAFSMFSFFPRTNLRSNSGSALYSASARRTGSSKLAWLTRYSKKHY